jgi:hypothetical protein
VSNQDSDDDEDETQNSPGSYSAKALNSSLALKHFPGISHAGSALQHSADGDSEEAAKSHLNAARQHERQADKLRQNGKPDLAKAHADAAYLHREAASMHRSSMTDNSRSSGPIPAIPPSVHFSYVGESPAAVQNAMSDHSFDTSPPAPGTPSSSYSGGPNWRDERYGRAPRVIHSASELFDAQEDDGRVKGAVSEEDQEGLAGKGDQDSHSPSTLFEPEVKSSKKTGYSQPVSISNMDAAYLARRRRDQARTGTLGQPNTMQFIINERLRECPQLRQP